MTYSRRTMALALTIGLGGTALLWALSVGAVPVSWAELARPGSVTREIFFRMRLTRVLLAAALGGLLATAGATLQGHLRNPLADPYLLGLSGGASLGAALGILRGTSQPAVYAVTGALLALLAVLSLSGGSGAPRATLLILSGAALHALTSAVLTLLLTQARRDQGTSVLFWLMGSLEAPPWSRLVPFLIVAGLVVLALWGLAPALNVLMLGEDTARSLGLSVTQVQWSLILLGSMATGLAVTFNGVIPFVGLIVPHAARLLVGSDHRWSLPASTFLGAGLVAAADGLGRVIVAPQEIPVGVMTALLGAPFFLVLLYRVRRSLG
jgi:iron complex transport system permease protein